MSWLSDAREAWQQHQENKQAWGSAESLRDLGERNNRWLDGEVTKTPGHHGPPDPESERIRDDLRELNQRGFVTTGSEPGWEEYGQHANVLGNTDHATAQKVRDASERGGLQFWGRDVSELPRRSREVEGEYHAPTKSGHDMSWSVFGLGEGAHRDIDNSVYVHVRDPEMGRERHLWDTLRGALREDEHEQESER